MKIRAIYACTWVGRNDDVFDLLFMELNALGPRSRGSKCLHLWGEYFEDLFCFSFLFFSCVSYHTLVFTLTYRKFV